MFKNQLIKKIVYAGFVLSVTILFSNVSWAQQKEIYSFMPDTVDKIIMDAERCISTKGAALSKCEEIVKKAEEQNKLISDQLQTCEENLTKKDELYGTLSKIKDDRLKVCEETSQKKDEIINSQQKTLEDTKKLVDEEKTKGTIKSIWSGIKWGIPLLAVGIIVGLFL